MNEWAEARVRGDAAFLEGFYAKEVKLTTMNGSVVKRAAHIAASSSKANLPEAIKDEDLSVSVYPDTAVMTGLEHIRGTYGGRTTEFAFRFTNVLVQRDGRWQLVAHQATVAPALPGQVAPEVEIYQQGPGVVMPKVIHMVEPSYTEPARKRKIKAVVRVEVVVDADGHLREPHVVKSAASTYSDPEDRDAALTLDPMAIDAVRLYTFSAGTFHDKPVPVLTVIETYFDVH
jgi:ketosteroid isomerase-like protein